jgi:hypothetical protein
VLVDEGPLSCGGGFVLNARDSERLDGFFSSSEVLEEENWCRDCLLDRAQLSDALGQSWYCVHFDGGLDAGLVKHLLKARDDCGDCDGILKEVLAKIEREAR